MLKIKININIGSWRIRLEKDSTNTNLIYQSLSSNKLFVYGDTDELIDEDVYNNLLRTICKPKEIIKINNTDHFFSNVIPKLSNKIGDFFNSTLK